MVTEILQEHAVIRDLNSMFFQKGVNHLPDYFLTTMNIIVSPFTVVKISDLIWHIHLVCILNILEIYLPTMNIYGQILCLGAY
jgi:hypothetical protein